MSVYWFRVKRWVGRLTCAFIGHDPERAEERHGIGPYRLSATVVRCPRCCRVLDVVLHE